MFHRVAIASLILIGLAMVALSLVWPQGQGAVSPGPFARPLAAPERVITVGGQPLVPLRGIETPTDAPAAQP